MSQGNNGAVVVGQYRGRPVSLIQDHPFYHRDGHMVLHRRYHYADAFRENGKPEKEVVWPPGTRLSELRLFGWEDLKRAEKGEPIFLVEGEPAVDALSKRGMIAVCLASSSLSDLSALDDLAAMQGNPIVVSPDNDDTGRKHAGEWHAYLKQKHPRVKWIDKAWPEPGGDFADLLALFGRDDDREAKAAVMELVEAAVDGPPQPTVAEVPSEQDELGDAIPMWGRPRPGPRPMLVEGIAPLRWPWMIFGGGGTGKSHLATHLALCIATGRDWFGHQVVRGNVLLVDSELDDDEADRRLWPISVGMGMDGPPEGVYYYRLPKALSVEDVRDRIRRLVERDRIVLVIVDSLTLSTYLSDQSAPNDISRIIFDMASWSVSVCFIDHEPKNRIGNDPDTATAFGSVFKGNLVRAQLYVQGGPDGTVTLRCRKSNFTRRWAPIALGVDFLGQEDHPDSVVYHRLAENDPRNLQMKSQQQRGEDEEALIALSEMHPEGVTAKQFGEYVGLTTDAARGRLGKMEREMKPPQARRVNPDERGRSEGRWLPTTEPPPPPPWE
jgi:hypothetical protein